MHIHIVETLLAPSGLKDVMSLCSKQKIYLGSYGKQLVFVEIREEGKKPDVFALSVSAANASTAVTFC